MAGYCKLKPPKSGSAAYQASETEDRRWLLEVSGREACGVSNHNSYNGDETDEIAIWMAPCPYLGQIGPISPGSSPKAPNKPRYTSDPSLSLFGAVVEGFRCTCR